MKIARYEERDSTDNTNAEIMMESNWNRIAIKEETEKIEVEVITTSTDSTNDITR